MQEATDGLPMKATTWPERMNFGIALMAIKDGNCLRRAGWNGKGMWIALQKPDANSKMQRPYIFMCPVDGDLVPWVASQTDLLADDWEVFSRAVDDNLKLEAPPTIIQQPSLGRIVLVTTHGEEINGQVEHAALVTQVWGPTCINVTIFPGYGEPRCYSSVQYQSDIPNPERGNITWRWPPRV